MIEIHQAAYNPDELSWEVIDSIAAFLRDGRTKWDAAYETLLKEDRELFDRVVEGDDTNATRDQWQGAEDEWRSMGAEFGVAVYDDGNAGWTYVGTEEEINDYIDREEENA